MPLDPNDDRKVLEDLGIVDVDARAVAVSKRRVVFVEPPRNQTLGVGQRKEAKKNVTELCTAVDVQQAERVILGRMPKRFRARIDCFPTITNAGINFHTLRLASVFRDCKAFLEGELALPARGRCR